MFVCFLKKLLQISTQKINVQTTAQKKKPVATAWGALGPLTSVMLVSIIKISMFIELSQGESDQ